MDYKHINEKYSFKGEFFYCPLELAMEVIGGKWKAMLIFHLQHGALRSGDLQRRVRGISSKMFTQIVRELEQSGIIERIVYPVVPPKVEYKLTELGTTVLPIILELSQWGRYVGTKCEL